MWVEHWADALRSARLLPPATASYLRQDPRGALLDSVAAIGALSGPAGLSTSAQLGVRAVDASQTAWACPLSEEATGGLTRPVGLSTSAQEDVDPSAWACPLSVRDARLAFARAQLPVVDELGGRRRAVGLTFFDFVEAVARIAWELDAPTRHELAAAGAAAGAVRGSSAASSSAGRELAAAGAAAGVVGGSSAANSGVGRELAAAGAAAGVVGGVGGGGHADGGDGCGVHPLEAHWRAAAAAALAPLPTATAEDADMAARGMPAPRAAAAPAAPRRLAPRFAGLMDYVGAQLMRAWGGADVPACAEKMSHLALVLGAGLELY